MLNDTNFFETLIFKGDLLNISKCLREVTIFCYPTKIINRKEISADMNATEKMKDVLINERPEVIEAATSLTISDIEALRFRSSGIHQLEDKDKIWLLNFYYSSHPEESKE